VIRWFEGNPVGQVLAVLAGVLLLLTLVLGVIWSLPPSSGTPEGEAGEGSFSVDVPQLPESEPIERFAVVTDRPVFNESRQPELEAGGTDGENPDSLAEEVVVDAPELELAGVVITPSLRMVTLRRKKERESLVAFEGQPLHGDYGSWHVSRIEPREITLAAGDGRELRLQLQVHDAKIAPPPKPKPEPTSAEVADNRTADEDSGASDRPLTRAEEIRQRIAERREELRRAAEEEKSGERPVSDYQTAIRSMIGAKPKPRPKPNENEDDQ
jgi:hypothetical protein